MPKTFHSTKFLKVSQSWRPCHSSSGFSLSQFVLFLHVTVTWHTVKHGDPYSEFMLCIYPSKCTHTAVNTYKPWTHTHTQWAVGSHFAAAPGEQLGVRCLAQGHLVVVLKMERALYIHSPQPFDYEFDSLTIRPRLHVMSSHIITFR